MKYKKIKNLYNNVNKNYKYQKNNKKFKYVYQKIICYKNYVNN